MPQFKKDLKPFQVELTKWSKGKSAIPMLADYGLGKTGGALKLLTEANDQSALLVVPKDIFKHWTKEIKKFTDYSSAVIMGNTQRKLALLNLPNINLTLINPEAARIHRKHLEKLAKEGKWQTLIIDELTRFRRPSKQTKALISLAKYIPRRMGLTGKIATEDYIDVFNPYLILFQHRSPFGKNFFQFREKYFFLNAKGKWIPTKYGTSIISKILYTTAFVRDRSDYYDDTDKVRGDWKNRNITLAKEQIALLTELQQDWQYTTPDISDPTYVNYATVKLQKQAQIISGFLYKEDGTTYLFPYNPKLQALTSMLEEIGTDPVVIWTEFQAEYQLIAALLKNIGKKLCPIDKHTDFNDDPSYDVYIGSLKKSRGLNLQRANHCIFFSRPYGFDEYSQAITRTSREGGWYCYYQTILTDTKVDKLKTKILKNKATMDRTLKEEGQLFMESYK